jgi:uncharacterized membrane protein YkoI
MNNRKILIRAAVAIAIGLSASGAPALATAKLGAAQKPKLSMSQARMIALKAYPGKIMKEELREVGVDAMTGRVLENIREGANPKD